MLSTGAVRALEEDELAAVLAHEHAHLRQRHHLVSALVEAIAAYLRWVPLIRAAADALPHYLEIAADDRARREAGTPALVSALVKLGERTHPAMPQHSCSVALHAAGPERIRHSRPPQRGAGRCSARRRSRRVPDRHGCPCRRRPPALRLSGLDRLPCLSPPEQEGTTSNG